MSAPQPASPQHGGQRLLLLAVDDSEGAQMMFDWVLENELRPEDSVHLVHVCIRSPSADQHVPDADYFDQAHPRLAERVTLEMLQRRFLSSLEQLGIRPVLHLVQASQDPATVGRIICTKGADLRASRVFVAASGRGRSWFFRLFAGQAVPEYCVKHCAVPLTVIGPAGPEAGGGGSGGAAAARRGPAAQPAGGG